MRKIVVLVALLGLGLSMNAQSVKLQSAIADLRNGRLKKAKENIDAASEHETTKNDAKTWLYKGLIYCQLGAPDVSSKNKDLCDDCFAVAYEAALRCKELDQGSNEYANLNNGVFRAVGGAFYNQAVDTYNKAIETNNKDLYNKTIELAEEVIKINNNSGDKSSTNDAYFIAGLSAEMLNDNQAIEKYYKPLVARKTDKDRVYKALFNIYKEQNDTTKAMNIATTYSTRNRPEDYASHIMMANAYLWVGNYDKAKESLNTALQKPMPSDSIKGHVLCEIGNVLSDSKEFEMAQQRFNEALALTNTKMIQFEANQGLGIMYYNKAAALLKDAELIPFDDATGKYDNLIKESDEQFRLAIPYFQKVIEMISKDQSKVGQYVVALRALKTIYARLNMNDKLPEITAKLKEVGLDN